MTATTSEPTKSGSPNRLQGRLGVMAIVFMVIAAAAPLTIIVSMPLNMLASNGAGIAVAYLIGPLILLVFAGGYAKMSMLIPKAGAFYSFVTASFGRPAGTGAGFMAILGYMLFQAFVYALFGTTLNATLASFNSPVNMEWWGWTIVAIVLVSVLGYVNIDLSARVLAVALVLEVVAVIVVDAAIIISGGGPGGISFTSIFESDVVFSGSLPLAIMFGLSVGLGFEATALFRDEARDPKRTIPRAIYISILSAAVFYIVAAWALFQGFGGPAVMDTIAGLDDPTALFFIAAEQYVGPVFMHIVSVLALTSMFACVLSYHNITSRYLHSLGHSVLPKRLSSVHGRHKSPHVASVATTGLSVVLFLVALVSGVSIFVVMQWEIAIATLSIMVLLTFTAAAIFVYFRRNRQRGAIWSTLVSPLFATILLGGVVITGLLNFGALSASADPLINVLLQIAPAVLFVAGVITAILARKRVDTSGDDVVEATDDADQELTRS